MKVHWIVLFIVLGAALSVPAVSAQIVEEKDGYVVTPAVDSIRLPDISRLGSSGILQGQTDTYSTYVSAGKTQFITNLYWGSTANSLSLTIDAPDSQLGPYYDSSDGFIDGRISLRISKASGLAAGTWWSDIYGYQVSGVQSYSYTAYAN